MRRLLACLCIVFCLSGCAAAAETGAFSEHGTSASMAGCLAATVYVPGEDGKPKAVEKTLPWERDMQAYVLSFVLEDPRVSYACTVDGRRAALDISGFPAWQTAGQEQCAVDCLVKTLLSLPGIDEATLSFDGERLVALRHGTEVHKTFKLTNFAS